MNRTPRQFQTERLRTAALRLVEAHGEWKQAGRVRAKFASIEDFEIALMTPSETRPEVSEEMKAWAERHGESDKLAADYSLEIWVTGRKKVLNIHWKEEQPEEQPVEVLSFRRGDWESELLDLGSREGG